MASLTQQNVLLSSSFVGSNATGVPRRLSAQVRRPSLTVASSTFDTKSVDVAQVKPQGNRLLVKLDEVKKATAGGVLLPSSALKYEAQLTGEVLSVGPEVKFAEPGQKVMFSDLNAYEVKLGSGDGKLCFVRDEDLMAVVS